MSFKIVPAVKNSQTVKLNTNNILPHIGWNNINLVKNDEYNILNGINLNADFYFVHSYNVITENKNEILATSKYFDTEFISIISTNNILAVQFHPEKSGLNGIKLFENFFNW